jgi:hypothetical protein
VIYEIATLYPKTPKVCEPLGRKLHLDGEQLPCPGLLDTFGQSASIAASAHGTVNLAAAGLGATRLHLGIYDPERSARASIFTKELSASRVTGMASKEEISFPRLLVILISRD